MREIAGEIRLTFSADGHGLILQLLSYQQTAIDLELYFFSLAYDMGNKEMLHNNDVYE
jgi:hypothetical protein